MIRGPCVYAKEEKASLSWGKGPAILEALLNGANRIPKYVMHK